MTWNGTAGVTATRAECVSRRLKARLVRQVIKSEQYWLDPRLGTFLELHPDQTIPLARAWYGSEMFPQMIYPQYVKALGAQRAHLMLDPRILCRTEQFLEWSRVYLLAHPQATADELRSAFAATLKTTKVFRGMRLDNEETALRLKRQGIKAAGWEYQGKPFIQEKLLTEIGLKPGSESGFGFELFNRPMNTQLEHSLLVSVSDWMELAASVGYYHGQAVKMAPGGKLFLFELEIPEFELIRQSGPLARRGRPGHYQIGEKTIEYDPYKVEAFVPYQVNPEWILKVHPYEHAPPKWEFKPSH